MAKKKRGRPRNSALGNAAASVGGALGQFAARYDSLNQQRVELARELQGYIKQAQGMAKGLSIREIPFPKLTGKAKKRRKMSAAARKKIGQAQKKRWAAKKASAAKPASKTKKSDKE